MHRFSAKWATFARIFVLLTVALPSHGMLLTEIALDSADDGKPVNRDLLTGTCLPIWNTPELYDDIRQGMHEAGFRLFRFPNGSLSNDYHWNGNGSYDSLGVWNTDTSAYEPGFRTEILHRGTSKSNYGFIGSSAITDGDSTTFWWSDPYITQTDPYYYLEMPGLTRMDSIAILFGERTARDFRVQIWSEDRSVYPAPHNQHADKWVTVDSVTGNTSASYGARFSYDKRVKYLRVISSANTEGAKDIQVVETSLYLEGEGVSRHAKEYHKQTHVVALPTHIANKKTSTDDWDFETFMQYVDSYPGGATPVICVNYGTGTPEEAAQWVRYANVKRGMGIRFWQVGNEMDGAWEEGGPVTAAMYAEKYLLYAKAMKAVDPDIKVFGPVSSSAEFRIYNSGDYAKTNWMQLFLRIVGEAEKADGVKYLDGVDYHSYPYWSENPTVAGLASKRNFVDENNQILEGYIQQYLLQPDSVYVFLSEYNGSVVMSDILHRPVNGAFVANLYAGMAHRFGDRAMSVVWDSFEGGDTGPDGSHGSLSLFNKATRSLHSSFGNPPAAIYWGLYALSHFWLGSDSSANVFGIASKRDYGLHAYGARSTSGTRVALLNFRHDSMAVRIDPAMVQASGITLYTWSEREFRWRGSDVLAQAVPNLGPSSTRLEASALDSLVLPPYSVNIVTLSTLPESPAAASPMTLVHFGANSTRVEEEDTLLVYGGWRQDGGQVSAVSYSLGGDSAKPLPALDGSYDGPVENAVLRLAAKDLPSGSVQVVLRATSSTGSILADTLVVEVLGKLNPVLLIDDFQDGDTQAAMPGTPKWSFYAHGKNNSKIAPEVLHIDGAEDDLQLKAAFEIHANQELGYPNFVYARLIFPPKEMDSLAGGGLGLQLRYAGKHSGGSFVLQVLSDTVKDFDDFHIPLENTGGEWKTLRLRWDQLTQFGWGAPAGVLHPTGVKGLEFRATGPGSGYLMLDDIHFLGRGDGLGIRSQDKRQFDFSGLLPGLDYRVLSGPQGILLRGYARRESELTAEAFTPLGRSILGASIRVQPGPWQWNLAENAPVAGQLLILRLSSGGNQQSHLLPMR